jgi:hypothetical protein
MELVKHSATVTQAGDIPGPVAAFRRGTCQLADGAGAGVLVSVDAAGEAEPALGVGAGDEVAGAGLLVGDGLLVGVGLTVGVGLLVEAGLLVADGDVVGELTDDVDTVGVATGSGSVAAGEFGNSVMTGSAAAALCLAAAGEEAGAGEDPDEAVTWICGPSRPCGATAALFTVPPDEPAELVGARR